MKHISYFVLAIFLMALPATQTFASFSQKRDTPIIISQVPINPIGAPRSSTTIEAFLDTEMFTIDVYLRNAGESATVDIENTTTGSTYQYSVSGNGSDVLPISSTSGFWTITFTLTDGRVYLGEFIM